MKRIAIYSRVSTSDGKQDYQRQVNELTAIAKRNGFTDKQITLYSESISGYKKDERLQLNAMLSQIEDNPSYFSAVYVSEISRLGRNPIQTRQIIDRLTELNVPVFIQSLNQFTIDDKGKRSMIVNIILQVAMEYANLEAETFKARSASGLRKAAMEGKYIGGVASAYGYTQDKNNYIIIDEYEAAVVKDVFKMYSEGQGTKKIANILTTRKIPTKYNRIFEGTKRIIKGSLKEATKITWSDAVVYAMLNNTSYIGEKKYKGEIIKTPAIIDKKLFAKCQEIMSGKSHRNYLTNYTFLFKDLITCTCGRNFYARYKPVEGGDKVYVCSSRLVRGGRCVCPNGINITLLESSIYDYLITNSKKLTNIESVEKMKAKLWSEIKSLTDKANIDQKAMKAKANEEKRLLDVYISGAITKQEFEAKKKVIKQEILVIAAREKILIKDVEEKHEAYLRADSGNAPLNALENAKNNRNELQALYRQILSKVNVESTSKETAVVSLVINAGKPVMIELDLSGIRRKPMQYQYRTGKDWVAIPEKRLITL